MHLADELSKQVGLAADLFRDVQSLTLRDLDIIFLMASEETERDLREQAASARFAELLDVTVPRDDHYQSRTSLVVETWEPFDDVS